MQTINEIQLLLANDLIKTNYQIWIQYSGDNFLSSLNVIDML